MTRPPFVILPIIAGLGIVIALAYWVLSIVMRPRQQPLKSVAVAHHATRPDYAAGFGAAPSPATPAPQPSAWEDSHPPTQPPAPAPAAEAAPPAPAPEAPLPATAHEVQPPPPAHEAPRPAFGDTTPAAPDEPPDLPEPGDD
jgi:hypothetical protein